MPRLSPLKKCRSPSRFSGTTVATSCEGRDPPEHLYQDAWRRFIQKPRTMESVHEGADGYHITRPTGQHREKDGLLARGARSSLLRLQGRRRRHYAPFPEGRASAP